jgi:hypothetical protein
MGFWVNRDGTSTYVHRVLVAVDLCCNVIIGGDFDETISSRAGEARDKKHQWGCALCWLLDKIDPRHCMGAILADLQRADSAAADLEKNE